MIRWAYGGMLKKVQDILRYEVDWASVLNTANFWEQRWGDYVGISTQLCTPVGSNIDSISVSQDRSGRIHGFSMSNMKSENMSKCISRKISSKKRYSKNMMSWVSQSWSEKLPLVHGTHTKIVDGELLIDLFLNRWARFAAISAHERSYGIRC